MRTARTTHQRCRRRSIPRSLRGILWMRRPRTLDLDCDRIRIIHHALAYGSPEDWRWLRRTYPLATIRRVFRAHPLHVYTPAAFHFAHRFILRSPPPRYATRYLRTAPRGAR